MAENYVLLETIELTQTASSVTLDNIPQTGYTDLKIVVSARNTTATTVGNVGFNMRINGATTGYTGKQLYGGGGTSVGSINRNNTNIGTITSANDTANCFNNAEIFIPDYTGSNPKIHSVDSISASNANAELDFVAKMQSTTSAVTSVTFICDTDSFAAGSTFSIYGVASTGTTSVIAPFASGGNIVANDGTYWYHAFLNSGTFIPTKNLSCDLLVVGGGGSGGIQTGGGGGAGGYRTATSQALTSSTNYAVTIGAGAATPANNTVSVRGTGSSFASLLVTSGGGGGAGRGNSLTLVNGGSGGGMANTSGTVIAGGAGNLGGYTPVEGFAGGSNGGDNGAQVAGGGGGATAVGANGFGASGNGAGGAGSNALSSWASATNTGVSGYYAGGGGGGNSGAGGAGGGGTGGVYSTSASGGNGVANTGGGGGGQSGAGGNAGTGGSGIVIVRYPMV